jgi:hypothetical protein
LPRGIHFLKKVAEILHIKKAGSPNICPQLKLQGHQNATNQKKTGMPKTILYCIYANIALLVTPS